MPDSFFFGTHKVHSCTATLLRSQSLAILASEKAQEGQSMTIALSLRNLVIFVFLSASTFCGAAAFEPPVFSLNESQLKALEEYGAAKTEKAFAAGPQGQFSAQTGFASLTIAAREALKACDKGISDDSKRCILIDLNGERLSDALQMAQMLRVDPSLFEKPMPVRDLVLRVDAWRAQEGYREKGEHKAFALSLKGPWARSWEGASVEDAEKEALASCNKEQLAKEAPCFILMRDGTTVPGNELQANPDLSVNSQKPQ
jgi:hypothetical protein